MILPLLLLGVQAPPAAGVDGLPLGAIARQELPAKGCAAFLWSRGPSHALIAMVTPGAIRVSLGGTTADLPQAARHGDAGFGFAANAEFTAPDATFTLELTVAAEEGLKDGARVPEAMLTIARPGQDTVAAPLAGLIGCAA